MKNNMPIVLLALSMLTFCLRDWT